MATRETTDVVIIGGGLAGVATAYYLGKQGLKSTIIEKDGLGGHASGVAYGGLGHLGGAGIPGDNHPVALLSMDLHREIAATLPQETGVDIEYRLIPAVSLAFTEEEAETAHHNLAWQQSQDGNAVRWIDIDEVLRIEPRVAPDALGAVLIERWTDLEPHRLVTALAQAAENLGSTVRYGEAFGLETDGDRATGVRLGDGIISCGSVVVATGPWMGPDSSWLGVNMPVRPLKGQILRLRVSGPPVRASIGWDKEYAVTKQDGLVWTGSTEEDTGMDEQPTEAARDHILASLRKMMPGLGTVRLVRQTACMRPMTPDKLLVLGESSARRGVFVAGGGGRQGIMLGPGLGRITADLIATGKTDVPIGPLHVDRFS